MDGLANYSDLINRVNQQKEELKEEATDRLDAAKEKLREFTNPFETGGQEALNRLIVGNVKKLGSKLNLPVDKALRIRNSYKSNGLKGIINEFKSDAIPKPTIASLSKSEFQNAYPSLKLGLDADVAKLSQEKQQQLKNLVQDNLKTKTEIPDDLERYQNNLHEVQKGLNQIGDEPQVQNKLIKTITNISPEDTELQGGLKSTTQIFKSNAEEIQNKFVSKASKLKSSAEKAASDAAETSAELGGPEDVAGDVISAAVGLSVFLGGLFGARSMKTKPPPVISSSYQIGA
jgi:hypothetical protein